MEITERILEGLRARTVSYSKEKNSDWNRFWGYIPHSEESHHWGECMEDWHDYE